MQYRQYDIQITDYGCIIRDSNRNYIACAPTESDAIDFINSIDVDYVKQNMNPKIVNWNKQFKDYCQKLPDKFYIDDYVCSYNKQALKQFKLSFENANNISGYLQSRYTDGEYYYWVEFDR